MNHCGGNAMYVAHSHAIAARILGGEMMVMLVRDSKFFTLNEIATVIWRASDGRTPLHEIAYALCDEFEVEFKTAYRDAEELVTRLSEHGILLVSDKPIAGTCEAASVAP